MWLTNRYRIARKPTWKPSVQRGKKDRVLKTVVLCAVLIFITAGCMTVRDVDVDVSVEFPAGTVLTGPPPNITVNVGTKPIEVKTDAKIPLSALGL